MAKSKKMPENGNVEPYQKREVKDDKKAMKSTNKSVKPVAKDTNKTRRSVKRSDITGPTVKAVKPKATSMNPRGVNKHGK